jgi:hypothetical protein
VTATDGPLPLLLSSGQVLLRVCNMLFTEDAEQDLSIHLHGGAQSATYGQSLSPTSAFLNKRMPVLSVDPRTVVSIARSCRLVGLLATPVSAVIELPRAGLREQRRTTLIDHSRIPAPPWLRGLWCVQMGGLRT